MVVQCYCGNQSIPGIAQNFTCGQDFFVCLVSSCGHSLIKI